MENFITWVFSSFYEIILELVIGTMGIIDSLFDDMFNGNSNLTAMEFNLSLFSDTPILTTNVYDIILLTFIILYTTIFIVIVWKIIKKVFVKITRWNKW